MERCRLERPDIYVRVIASLLPKQQTEKVNPFDEFSDDELRALEEWLEAHRAGKGGKGRQEPPDTFFLPRAESA